MLLNCSIYQFENVCIAPHLFDSLKNCRIHDKFSVQICVFYSSLQLLYEMLLLYYIFCALRYGYTDQNIHSVPLNRYIHKIVEGTCQLCHVCLPVHLHE